MPWEQTNSEGVLHSLPILFVSSEAEPFAPDGDLAKKVHDLATGIAKKKENHYVAVIIPGYKRYLEQFKGKLKPVESFYLREPYETVVCHVHEVFHEGVQYFLLEIPTFFDRDEMYGYPDDSYRFTAFDLAVFRFVKNQERHRIRYDVVHAFEWETGFLPYLLRNEYPWMRVVYTVNEPDYQCSLQSDRLWNLTHFDYSLYTSGVARQNDRLNLLKTGLTLADVVTVSDGRKADILRNDFQSYQNLGYIFNFKGKRFVSLDDAWDTAGYDKLYNAIVEEDTTRYTWVKED